MKFLIHHVYSEAIRPERCVVCHDADAVRVMNIGIRIPGTKRSQDLQIPCCLKDADELFAKFSLAIEKQDKEREP